MEYVRLCEGFSRGKLIPVTDDVWNHISTNQKDFYVSLYRYTEDHYNQWKQKGTVAGIRDVTTNKILFDFDHAAEPEKAQADAITVVTRLMQKGIPQENIQVSFSGSKGFNVVVDTTERFTPEQFRTVVNSFAGDLPTFDTVVSDPQRIIRLVGTKHNKSGLFKYPLSVSQLSELDIDQIKLMAKRDDDIDEDIMRGWHEIQVPEAIKTIKESKKLEAPKAPKILEHDLDMTKKPKWLSEAKYALQEGYFEPGERNTAFMILASTYKNESFTKGTVYRMLKGCAELQAARSGQERYSDAELYNNVVEIVFSPNWKGGTYSYENTPLLQNVTARLGLKIPNKEDQTMMPLKDVSGIFKKFATEIDANTIKLGIPAIDADVRVTTSMLVGLVAPPGGGKTTCAFEIMNNASKADTPTMFFSMDMGAPLVFQRLIQKHTGMYSRKIFDLYKNNDPQIPVIEKTLTEEYNNVSFCFKSGLSVEEIREAVIKEQERTEKKIRLVVIDYLECISSGFSDPTASGAYVTQKLKDLANELECTVLLLLQPPKVAGDPSDELLSYTKIKGSSVIQQACSVIFSMWRPGFSPKAPAQDRYVSFAVLKNRMGTLGQYDFGWDGLTGAITELDDEGRAELNAIKKRKAEEKAASSSI